MFRRQPRAIFRGVFKPTLHRRRVGAGQNTRGTPTVNHDSRVGANENNHGTTAAQHTYRRPTKQEICFKNTPEDGARLAPKHVGKILKN
jgi:hypothetical protein